VPLALLTGGSGSLGQRLLPALREAGWRSRCLLHRRPVPGADEEVSGDLAEPASLAAAAAGVDAVLHLAAVTHARSPRRYREANLDGTANLLRACAPGTRFAFVSSRTAGAEGGGYAESKLLAERAVAAAGLPFAILRLPELYGTGGEEGVEQIIARAARGAPIPVVGRGEQRLRPLHVDDVLAPTVAALEPGSGTGEAWTLAGEEISVRGFAEACVELSGSGSRIVSLPRPLVAALSAAARIAPLPLAPDQLRRLEAPKQPPTESSAAALGFAPRPLREGLREALAAYV
jgi:nucleoside-diphosphate-sugar epimerase